MMSVEKFKNPDEARKAMWTGGHSVSVSARIRSHWELCRRLAPTERPRGVRMFRCLEDAQMERAQTRKANVLKLRRLRKPLVDPS